MKPMNNVALYLRKSREEETETREETLARHERILLDYCSANNLDIVKTYKEVVSGESIENRPEMQKLLNDVKLGMFEGVVVVELERLSRGNQMDQAEILEVFKKSNTKIYTLNKVYDLSSDDEFDEEFFEFGLFMSRREYKIIKRRLMRGRKQALKEGYFIAGTPPYGYTKERIDKGFVLIPKEFESKVVQTIFYKYVVEDCNVGEIQRWLRENDIKPIRANGWDIKRIRWVLRNKTYIGYLACDYKSGSPQNYVKGKHKGIVDEDLFNLAQQKLNSRMTRICHDRTLVNPLASIAKCGLCGRTMRVRYSTNKNRYHFKCGHNGCPTVLSYLEDVEKQVIKELEEELKGFNYFLENFDDEIQKKKTAIQSEIDILNKEVTKKESMVEKCCEMLEEGIYSKEKYLTRVNILESDLNALKSNIKALQEVNFDESDRAKSAIPILENVLKEYWSLDPTGRNELLKTIVDKIIYTKSEKNTKYNRGEILFNLEIYLKI